MIAAISGAAESANQGSGSGGLILLMLGALGFWFLIVRPNRRRARGFADVQRSLASGAEVMTSAGFYGTVVEAEDGADSVLLELAPGVRVRCARGAIARRLDAIGPTAEQIDAPE